jgi:hypothetical protein
MKKNNVGFRSWYYFRQGWSTYFAFVFAAINTLTVTYYLAIEKYPTLKEIFPTFLEYIAIISIIGIPSLIFIGYLHYKKTAAYRSEADIIFETNPFVRRQIVNTEILVHMNLRLLENLIKVLKDQKYTEKEIEQIVELKNEVLDFVSERKFSNTKDLEFLKKRIDI